MEGNGTNAYDSLSEQARKLDIASYYTHGDFERAKSMVSGAYQDMYVLKGRFSSSSMYGAFILFFNKIYNQIAHFYSIVSQSYAVGDIKTNQGWKNFEKEIESARNEQNHDDVLGNQLYDALSSFLTVNLSGGENKGSELCRLIEQDEAIAVNHLLQKVIVDKIGYQNVSISIDYEPISSLDMETDSISSKKLTPNDLKKEEPKEEPAEAKQKSADPLQEKEVKLQFNGGLVLSPIKGKDVSQLEVGDRIKISIIDKNPKVIDLAKAFDAYTEEGKFKPISGRIISIDHSQKNGYKIFAIVAKGIYARIEEEEENIKVAMDTLGMASKEGAADAPKKASAAVIIVLAVVLVILLGVVLAFLL